MAGTQQSLRPALTDTTSEEICSLLPAEVQVFDWAAGARRAWRAALNSTGKPTALGSPATCFASISLSEAAPHTAKRTGRQRKAAPVAQTADIAHFNPSEAMDQGLQSNQQWRKTFENVGAGATAGAAVEAALYPIDTIKTRLQSATSGGGLRALLQSGGGKALYAGLLGNLAGVIPASAIFMGIYEPAKQTLEKKLPKDRQFLGALGGGAAAGFAASFVRVPTEVIKQRMQTGEFAGPIKAVTSVALNEGFRGFFAGYGSFLLRDLPFDALEFVLYEQIKKGYQARLKNRKIKAYETSAIGAAAGAVTGVATTPLDVVKTRLMTQGRKRTYKGVIDCFQKVIEQEGSSALFKGWEPRVLWIGLGGCVFFTALEEAKKVYARI